MTFRLPIALRRFVLPCMVLAATAVSGTAQDSRAAAVTAEWRVLYATDSAGRPARGEKVALLLAVRSGQPIRVGWKVPWRLANGTVGMLEHAASAAFLTIHHGEVFAQLAPILGQAPAALEPRVILRTTPPQIWYGWWVPPVSYAAISSVPTRRRLCASPPSGMRRWQAPRCRERGAAMSSSWVSR